MAKRLRIVFMGTPEFAIESLRTLLDNGQNIVAVITSPDKPTGRGKQLMSSPVKEFARKSGVTHILQPANLKDPRFIDKLKALKADLQIVVAFRMLPEIVWSMPLKGTVNLHASLLPDYRGAAPINWAIINGEKKTGVTTFFIDKEIDTGKIIYQESVEITPEMNAGELHDILMIKGARLLSKTVNAISENDYPAIPQSEYIGNKEIQLAPKLFKDDCRLSWSDNPEKIYNTIRGLSPYPTAWTEISDGSTAFTLKIYESRYKISEHSYHPGTLLSDGINYLKVAVGNGFIELLSVQLSGKKRMAISDFLRGFKNIEKFNIVP